MKLKTIFTIILLALLVVLTSACKRGGSADAQVSTPAPEAVFTSAAKTAEARRVEKFSQTATLPVEAIIETSAFASATATSPRNPSPGIADLINTRQYAAGFRKRSRRVCRRCEHPGWNRPGAQPDLQKNLAAGEHWYKHLDQCLLSGLY